MSNELILLRHGQSEWNRQNLFTGWYDSPLSEKGRAEATQAGKLLVSSQLIPACIHTSMLMRAVQTTELVLAEINGAGIPMRLSIPVRQSWRLNERHYGNLTGLNKQQAVLDYGQEQVFEWRRKYNVRPPEMSDDNPYAADIGSVYSDGYSGIVEPPKTECLADVLERLLPYWQENIIPDLKEYGRVLISAHGNSLRALIKHLDNISEDEISSLNIPTGIPLKYDLNEKFQPAESLPVEKRYLGDAQAAMAAAAKVAEQTRKIK